MRDGGRRGQRGRCLEHSFPFIPAQQQLTKKDVGRGQGWQLGEERHFWNEEFWQGVEGAVLARP